MIFITVAKKKDIAVDRCTTLPYWYAENAFESRQGYTLLRSMLVSHGITYRPEKINRKNGGKPYVLDCTYSFSLSYSADYVVCALSIGDGELGVDIEQPRAIKDGAISKILTKTELQKGTITPYQAWVYKEAYGKFTGEGVQIGFSKIVVEDICNKIPFFTEATQKYLMVCFYANAKTKPVITYNI